MMLKNAIFPLLFIVLMSSVGSANDTARRTPDESLASLRDWLRDNAVELIEELNPPATQAEIIRFERQTGLTLPSSVRAAYGIHNGERSSSQGIFGAWRWLPLGEILLIRRRPGEYGIQLTDEMIPILASGGGDYFYVESASTSSQDNEVIEWWHEDPARNVKYSSFAAMLSAFVAKLEQDQFIYLADEFVGLVNKDDL